MDDAIKKSRSAGGIVVNGDGAVAMVRREGAAHWLFPKGHLDPGEDDEAAARREIMEESGLEDLELLADLGEYERPRMRKDGTARDGEMKEIRMFLFRAKEGAMLAPTMEMEEARWVKREEVGSVLGNDKDREWFLSVLPEIERALR